MPIFTVVAGYSADKKAKVRAAGMSQDFQKIPICEAKNSDAEISSFGGWSKKSQVVLINAGRLDFDQKLDLSKISAIADTGQLKCGDWYQYQRVVTD